MKFFFTKENIFLKLSLVSIIAVSCAKKITKQEKTQDNTNILNNFATTLNILPEKYFTNIANSSQNVCALEKNTQAIHCWNLYSDTDNSGIPSNHYILNDNKYKNLVLNESFICGQSIENKWFCGKVPFQDSDNLNLNPLNINNLPKNSTFNILSLTDEKICGLNTINSLVYCWEINLNSSEISDIPTLYSETEFIDFKISGSKLLNSEFSCGIDKKNTIYCKGNNNFGQLGNATNKNSITFIKIEFPNENWQQVELGSSHACALTERQEMYCWGSNHKAQLGLAAYSKHFLNNTETTICKSGQSNCVEKLLSPRKIENYNKISKIFVNSDTSCFQDQTKKIYCFGDNTYGQINNNSISLIQQNIENNFGSKYFVSAKPLKVSELEFSNISLANTSLCGINASNEKLQCYGFLFKNRFSQISTGQNTACGLTTEENGKHLLCLNIENEEPNKFESNPWNTSHLMPWTSLISYKEVQQSKEYSCGIRSNDHSIDCWSKKENTLINKISSSINKVMPINFNYKNENNIKIEFTKISTGVNHICGIDSKNNAYCWGNNSSGQLGNGSFQYSKFPVKVVPDYQEEMLFKDITVGNYHTCAITLDDKLYCWGENKKKQLGDSAIIISSEFPNLVEVESASFKKVIADGNYTCAETNTNELFCWGQSSEGIFINSENKILSYQETPKKIQFDNKFIEFSTKDGTICIVTNNNELFCKGKLSGQKNSKFNKIEREHSSYFHNISVGYKTICGIRKINENLITENPYIFDMSLDCWKN